MVQVALVQVHEDASTARAGASSRWRRCTTTSRRGLEGDAGRGALLDHHDAAVPGRPVDPEAAVSDDTTICRRLVLDPGPRANPGLAMARWCARQRRRACASGDSRAEAAAGARRCAAELRVPQRRARRRRRSVRRDCSTASTRVFESPGLAPHRRSASPRCCGRARSAPTSPVAGRARPVRRRRSAHAASRRARLRAEGPRHHRHQRQDDRRPR